jgi:homoserine acetyltransferase
MRRLSALLGAPNRLVELPTLTGHDAFLTEPAAVGAIVRSALASPTAVIPS